MISFEGDPIQHHSVTLRKWQSLQLMEFLIQSVPDQQSVSAGARRRPFSALSGQSGSVPSDD